MSTRDGRSLQDYSTADFVHDTRWRDDTLLDLERSHDPRVRDFVHDAETGFADAYDADRLRERLEREEATRERARRAQEDESP